MSTARPNDPFAPLTRAELSEELRPLRDGQAAIEKLLARIDERLISIDKHGATKAFVLGTILSAIGIIAVLLGTATAIIISRLP